MGLQNLILLRGQRYQKYWEKLVYTAIDRSRYAAMDL